MQAERKTFPTLKISRRISVSWSTTTVFVTIDIIVTTLFWSFTIFHSNCSNFVDKRKRVKTIVVSYNPFAYVQIHAKPQPHTSNDKRSYGYCRFSKVSFDRTYLFNVSKELELLSSHNMPLMQNYHAIDRSRTCSVWPILDAVIELLPMARTRTQNVLLFSLWIGRSRPNFNLILEKLSQQLIHFEKCRLEDRSTTAFTDPLSNFTRWYACSSGHGELCAAHSISCMSILCEQRSMLWSESLRDLPEQWNLYYPYGKWFQSPSKACEPILSS